MKAFQFSLQRALEWRNTQVLMEEAKLESLRGGLRELDRSLEQLSARRQASAGMVNPGGSVQGNLFCALEEFRQWLNREERGLRTRIQQASEAVQAQQAAVVEARRKARLLERLRAVRHTEWKKAEDLEMETLAGEFAIAQWRGAQLRGQP
jgi:flagellar biosynthesis chaperone FliJ